MYNFDLVNCDTDSIMVCKPNGEKFSEKEQENLLKELNSLFPEMIRWEADGNFETVIISKAKNYVMWDGKKLIIKGSSLKDPKREPALKEFINAIIQSIIDKKYNYVELYEAYVREILNVKDIKRWCSKKTVTSKVMESERLNEIKIKEAIAGSEYREGDKIYLYYTPGDNLKLVENFDGRYNKTRLLKKVHNTIKIFANIVDMDQFINYSLVKQKEALKRFE
jgi:hypothetical protein